MKNEIKNFLEMFNKVIIEEIGRFLYLVRDKNYQKEAIDRLIKLRQQAVNLKEKMINESDEENANILLSIENIAEAIVNELKMWIALKEDKVNEAWDYLVDAQSAIRTALQAHEIALKLDGERYANKLHLIEKLIFPSQAFFSPGFVIEEAKCSVYGKNYEECEHIVGKAYMGKMCYRIITKCKLKEVSIVESPGNKKARALTFIDGNIIRDYMTWRIIKDEENGKN